MILAMCEVLIWDRGSIILVAVRACCMQEGGVNEDVERMLKWPCSALN